LEAFFKLRPILFDKSKQKTLGNYKWMWKSFCQPKHKVLFLASFEGQAKYKKYLEKENYAP
jgi:hypothetical protein